MYKLLCVGLMTVFLGAGSAHSEVVFHDLFEDGMDDDWTWLREESEDWRLRDGALEIRIRPGDAHTVQNALKLPVPEFDGPLAFEVTVTQTTPFTQQYEQAGLTWYADGEPAFKLVHELIDDETFIIPGRPSTHTDTVRLRLVVRDDGSYIAQFRQDGEEFYRIAAEGEIALGSENHISLQGYHGPADGDHWFRFSDFRIVTANQHPALLVPTVDDMPTWMDAMLPENAYIATHAERRVDANAPWQSIVDHLQLFRSQTNRDWQQVYFRKDAPQDYYGEFFTYDDKTVRLHTETYPRKTHLDPPDAPEWQDRPDRLRLFVEADPNDWGLGRVIAPVQLTPDWEYRAAVNTYLANTFGEINNGTATRYQTGVQDHVTITVESPFNVVYDGEAEGWSADPEFAAFDEAVIVNQHMNNNEARERFIFARKGETFYGIVRWDVSRLVDGEWEVVGRTIGMHVAGQDEPFTFAGMRDRARALDVVAPFPKSDD